MKIKISTQMNFHLLDFNRYNNQEEEQTPYLNKMIFLKKKDSQKIASE